MLLSGLGGHIQVSAGFIVCARRDFTVLTLLLGLRTTLLGVLQLEFGCLFVALS